MGKKIFLGASLASLAIVSSLIFSLVFTAIFSSANKTNLAPSNNNSLISSQDEAIQSVAENVGKSVVSIISTENGTFGDMQGAGTGFIIGSDGLIITNKHVVPEGINEITIVLFDGTKIDNAKVVGRDPSNDLAFVKVDGNENLPVAILGDSSKLKPGQTVVAIGNALGQFQNTITSGIVSGVGRPIEASDSYGGSSELLYNLIQTDTAINPGNSGGPLVNINGEIVGINVAASTEAENIGFAIPINDAKLLIEQVSSSGKISRAYLGVSYIPMNKEAAGYVDSKIYEGAYINSNGNTPAVLPGSPADEAGIKAGDILTKVNDQNITKDSPLASIINKYKPGETIEIVGFRGNQQIKFRVTLSEKN